MTKVFTNVKLSDSSFSHKIAVPIEKVDIADWLFSLPEAEYQRCCPPDHVAAGSTTTDDGRPMSICVEMIGQTLMVQNYVGEIVEKTHCHMVSISDAFTPNGRTTVQVTWDLSVKKIDADTCEYTNSVVAHPTEEFMAFIKAHSVTFEDAAAARQRDGGDHNRRETPLFAESIRRKALAKSN
jgi:hypothetical protein